MLVQGTNLFPLNNIESNLTGYFLDINGFVYSTKTGKALIRLAGSSSGYYKRKKHYTLSGRSYSAEYLIRVSKNHMAWAIAFPATIPAKAPAHVMAKPLLGSPVGRSYAKSMTDAISTRGVIIASVEGDKLVFGTSPKIHTTESSYRGEMERLASTVPGTKFVALKIVGSVIGGGVKWE